MVVKIPIRPRPKGRPRFYQGHAITPQETREYETAIGMEAGLLLDEPLKGAINLNVEFGFSVKSGGTGWHTKKPDIDNLLKAIMDALNGIIWEDDKQVCAVCAMKIYGAEDYVKIGIEELKE